MYDSDTTETKEVARREFDKMYMHSIDFVYWKEAVDEVTALVPSLRMITPYRNYDKEFDDDMYYDR